MEDAHYTATTIARCTNLKMHQEHSPHEDDPSYGRGTYSRYGLRTARQIVVVVVVDAIVEVGVDAIVGVVLLADVVVVVVVAVVVAFAWRLLATVFEPG